MIPGSERDEDLNQYASQFAENSEWLILPLYKPLLLKTVPRPSPLAFPRHSQFQPTRIRLAVIIFA